MSTSGHLTPSAPRADPPTDPTGRTDLAAAYAELQDLLLERADVAAFLQQATALVAQLAPGVSCSVTLRRDREVASVASSDDFAAQVDEIQYGRGVGPCLQAMQDEDQVSVSDLAADDRWGAYRVHAMSYGVRSSLSLPLVLDGRSHGALNLYGRRTHVFDEPLTARVRAFARQLSTALTLVLRTVDREALEVQLREAMAARAVIDQAVGIVMGQRRVAAPEAFAVLREISQTRNRKLRMVAADLIQSVTGRPPVEPRPFTERRG